MQLVKRYWNQDVTESTLSEYCLVDTQQINTPLTLKKTLIQSGIVDDMGLTGK